ncbi:hypothetical protein MASR2M12_09690 [Bacteroidales bacterium]
MISTRVKGMKADGLAEIGQRTTEVAQAEFGDAAIKLTLELVGLGLNGNVEIAYGLGVAVF